MLFYPPLIIERCILLRRNAAKISFTRLNEFLIIFVKGANRYSKKKKRKEEKSAP